MRRRGLALTGLSMVASGLVWAAVAWAETTVRVDGPKDDDVTLEKDEAKFLGRYIINGERQNVNGYSLERVLGKAGIGRADWTRVFVNGIEVARGEEFSGDRVPAFAFRKKTEDVFFIRPKQGDAPAVTKGANSFDLNYRIPIEIESSPDLDEAEAGDSVKFEASVSGPESAYTFDWDANGQTGTGRTFEYTLPSSGGDVTVNVEGTRNGNVQAEQTLSTSVKKPPPANTGGSGFGGGTSFGGDFGGDYGGGYSAPDYSPNFPSTGGSSSDFPADKPKTPDPDEAPPVEETGTSVNGELLSATTPLAPTSGDAAGGGKAPEPEPQEAAEEAKKVSAPGALIAAGVVVGLLGLGAGREMEKVRPRRFLRRPDLSGLRRLSPPWK